MFLTMVLWTSFAGLVAGERQFTFKEPLWGRYRISVPEHTNSFSEPLMGAPFEDVVSIQFGNIQ